MLRQSVNRWPILCISVGPQLQASRAAIVSHSSQVRARDGQRRSRDGDVESARMSARLAGCGERH